MGAIPRLVIGATGSGVGKTSLTLALTHALRRRGLRVQTFKAGPDFLDPSWLALASGRPCYNLDGWMCGEAYVRGLFARAAENADIALIEGVMGLFDGADPATSAGSTAEIARWLAAPVLLLVNAHGVARTLAATVKGFAEFEPGVRVGGVVANQAGSAGHAGWLAESLRAADLPPLLGAIGRDAWPALPSRHLGLVTADAHNLTRAMLDSLADALERGAQLDAILDLARSAPALHDSAIRNPQSAFEKSAIGNPQSAIRNPQSVVRVGVAWDAAFHFYYPDNLEALEAAGCELVRFSPLADQALPEGLDGLYLGGGYPEVHAAALADNRPLLEAVRAFAGSGRPVYAECGGLMLLAQGIETLDGSRHAMAGVLPAWTRMLPRRKALGYVEVRLRAEAPLGAGGVVLRGHEFHYSELIEEQPAHGWQRAYALRRRRAQAALDEGFLRGRVMASYVHAHFAACPGAAEHFAQACGSRS